MRHLRAAKKTVGRGLSRRGGARQARRIALVNPRPLALERGQGIIAEFWFDPDHGNAVEFEP